MAIPPTDINWIEKYGNMDWGNAMKTGDFGLTDAERDSQLQRTIAINNQEMAKAQARRAAEQAAVNQPVQGVPMPGYRPNPMMGPSYPYQIPNRNFTWQTTPQEQMALAGRMNRQDLQPLLGSGEYGPLAGQQYRYTPQGTTQINYGPGGGYGSGFGGGYGWPGGLLGGGVIDGGFGGGAGGGAGGGGFGGAGGGGVGVTGGNVQTVDEIRQQELASQIDQFAVNPYTGPGRNWTAPVNPYGTSPQGYQTAEQFANMQDFQKALADPRSRGTAATPLTGPEQFGTMPTAAETAARQAAARTSYAPGYQQFDTGAEEAITYPFATTAGRIEGEVARSQAQRQALGDQQRQAEMQRRVVQSQREQEARVRADEFASAQRAADQRAAAQEQDRLQRRDAAAVVMQTQQRDRGAEQAKQVREQASRAKESAKRAQQQSRAQAASRAAASRAQQARVEATERSKRESARASQAAAQAASRARAAARERATVAASRRAPAPKVTPVRRRTGGKKKVSKAPRRPGGR